MDTYSREYLQSLPEKKKREEVDAIIRGFITTLRRGAELGETSYFFDMSNMRKVAHSDPRQKRQTITYDQQSQSTTMTNEEIAERFQAAFPGCSVKYDEQWVETNASTKVFKRGITIEWS